MGSAQTRNTTGVHQTKRRRLWHTHDAGGENVRRSLLFDLPEFEVDRRGAAEDGHSDFDMRSGFVDFLNHAIEGGERPVRHPHVFTNLNGVGNIEVNAFQRLSDVVIQKSLREGFGLVVSEALWKGTPVVAGRAGGIPLQLQDGVGGFLVDSVDACAERILWLLHHADQARVIGAAGRERVREHFLLTRLLADDLRLYSSLLSGASTPLVHTVA